MILKGEVIVALNLIIILFILPEHMRLLEGWRVLIWFIFGVLRSGIRNFLSIFDVADLQGRIQLRMLFIGLSD